MTERTIVDGNAKVVADAIFGGVMQGSSANRDASTLEGQIAIWTDVNARLKRILARL